MLRRDALPRPELLAVFVRACGDEQHLAQWLSTREHLAVGPHLDQTPPPAAAEPDLATQANGWRRTAAIAAAAVVVGALAAVTWWSYTGPDSGPAAASSHPDVLPLASAGSWVRIRPAAAADLCLTEGREHTGRYDSAIAALRPCAEPGGPRVFLQPVGTDLATIKWEHPVSHVLGCLTVVDTEPIKDMLEPQENCVEGDKDQLFRIEHVGDQRYQLRTPDSGLCLGLRENGTVSGTEALRQPCATVTGQQFLVDPDTGGRPSN